MNKLRIHVYSICWNEEKILPYFLGHYSEFAEKIIIYDNISTDSSPAIIRSCSIAELRHYDTDNTFDDGEITKIMNTAYRESLGKADFVIVVGIDEFLYHPKINDLLQQYKHDGITMPKIKGFNMVSWCFPCKVAPITEIIRKGYESPSYAKRCIYHPAIDVNFSHGCHSCSPSGIILENKSFDLKLLHYHYIGFLRNIRKHKIYSKRLSKYNLDHGYGYQFSSSTIKLFLRFVLYSSKAHNII